MGYTKLRPTEAIYIRARQDGSGNITALLKSVSSYNNCDRQFLKCLFNGGCERSKMMKFTMKNSKLIANLKE